MKVENIDISCQHGDGIDTSRRQSASSYLKRLCDIGVLEERKTGREKLFTNPALLRILTQTDS